MNGVDKVVISGVYIQVKEGYLEEIVKLVEKKPGVEVQQVAEGTKIIITIESPTAASSQKICEEIQRIDHVLGVYPAYINFEGEEENEIKGVEH